MLECMVEKQKRGRPVSSDPAVPVHLRLPPKLLAETDARAELEALNRTQVIIKAIRAYLATQADAT
jgi:metal-responsive CopG/Arc/MetJ family transcriptional regulator